MNTEVRGSRITEPFFILKFYIMITKFNDCDSGASSIEFKRENDTVIIEITEDFSLPLDVYSVTLSEDDLFMLIGQLLRIQSEIKKL
jgi:hypothetical protein